MALLRGQEKRLRKSELKPPVRGLLNVGDSNIAAGGSFKRQARVAMLYVYTGGNNVHSQVLPPLFDPQLLRIDDTLSTLSTLIGIELGPHESATGRTSEFVQAYARPPLPVANSAVVRLLTLIPRAPPASVAGGIRATLPSGKVR